MAEDTGAVVGLVPVKAFALAKGRLAASLAGPSRANLAQYLATQVVRAFAPLPVAVACEDDQVAQWAKDLGAQVLWVPGTDLNGAVQQSFQSLQTSGVQQVIVCHGDLPYPERLPKLAGHVGITLVPDRVGGGTNVLSLPTTVPFTFQYGPGSFRRHLAQANRLRLPTQVRYDSQLSIDIDHPVDLGILALDPNLASLVEELTDPPS